MNPLTPQQVRQKKAEANRLAVTLHIGKSGITDATVAELDTQLRQRKLVKVRLLPTATEGGTQDRDQAAALAQATQSTLIEVRGHTAVYYRA